MFSNDDHAASEVTWSAYYDIIDAYQAKDPAERKKVMNRLIDAIKARLPEELNELRTLGRTMNKR